MKNIILKKTMIFGIIILFIGASITSSMSENTIPITKDHGGFIGDGANDYFINNGDYYGFYKAGIPSAYRYGDELFICYTGAYNFHAHVIKYNTTTCTWSPSEDLGSLYPYSKGAPRIFVNDSGYVYVVFLVTKDTQGYYKVSNSPQDITSWKTYSTSNMNLPSTASWVKFVYCENNIFYCIYWNAIRGNREAKYVYTTDGGFTWSLEHPLINSSNGSPNYGGLGEPSIDHIYYKNGRIHFVWDDSSHSLPNGGHRNLTYAYLKVGDNHVYNASNVDLGTVVDTEAEYLSCMVYQTHPWSPYPRTELGKKYVIADENDYPHILFAFPNAQYDLDDYNWSWNYTYWDGQQWIGDPAKGDVPYNITGPDTYGDSSIGLLRYHSSTDIKAFLPVVRSISHPHQKDKHGGDIEQWDWNGSSWAFNQTIIAEDDIGQRLNCGQGLEYETNPYYILIAEYLDHMNENDGKLYLWEYGEGSGLEPLVADADGPYSAFVGVNISFQGNATGGIPPYTYLWDFGNGDTSTEEDPIYAYDAPGIYDVTLTVTDSRPVAVTNETIANISEPPIELEISISGGFGVTACVNNVGEWDAEEVNCSLSITGGILGFINKEVVQTFDIPIGESRCLSTGIIFGFGGVGISATADEEEVTTAGTQLLIFTFVT